MDLPSLHFAVMLSLKPGGSVITSHAFCSSDLDFDPMTFMY